MGGRSSSSKSGWTTEVKPGTKVTLTGRRLKSGALHEPDRARACRPRRFRQSGDAERELRTAAAERAVAGATSFQVSGQQASRLSSGRTGAPRHRARASTPSRSNCVALFSVQSASSVIIYFLRRRPHESEAGWDHGGGLCVYGWRRGHRSAAPFWPMFSSGQPCGRPPTSKRRTPACTRTSAKAARCPATPATPSPSAPTATRLPSGRPTKQQRTRDQRQPERRFREQRRAPSTSSRATAATGCSRPTSRRRTPGNGDYFGSSVELSADGNTLAVAAHWEASAATGVNGNQDGQLDPPGGRRLHLHAQRRRLDAAGLHQVVEHRQRRRGRRSRRRRPVRLLAGAQRRRQHARGRARRRRQQRHRINGNQTDNSAICGRRRLRVTREPAARGRSRRTSSQTRRHGHCRAICSASRWG